jgi:putative oxidoreductase
MTRDALLLRPLERGTDLALLILRLMTGVFLIHGVWDNITSAEQMEEFSGFLAAHNFPLPRLMAPLSVYAQFLCGIALVAGLATRWAGLVLAFNFIVAVAMVHLDESYREIWPAAVLVGLGLAFATIGAGRLSIDALLEKRA